MNSFFEDEFINKKILTRLKREVKKEQLDKTISEINYLNELQINFLKRYGLTEEEEKSIKLINNATRKNIQA